MNKYEYLKPAEIEAESMRRIEKEFREKELYVRDEDKAVMFRVIHTSADFDYGQNLCFSQNACKNTIERMKKGGFVIVTDTNMALSGISKPSLEKLGGRAFCFMAEAGVAEIAKEEGSTRAAAAVKFATERFPAEDTIYAVGNAPTALITLSELMRGGFRPALVIGVPVGFVNVAESKEDLIAVAAEKGVEVIAALGRKGGSNVAAAVCNALLYQATDKLDPGSRWG